MKLKTMMIAALAAMTLASCSKDGEKGNTDAGEKASLSINVTSAATRATGNPATDKVDDYTVFVTNGAGEIGWSEYTADPSISTELEVTSNAAHVFIVANAGNLTQTITTKAALDNYLLDMTQTSGNQFTSRVATGRTSQAIVFTTNSSGDMVANVSIDLTFIAARITVKIVDNMGGLYTADADGDGSLVLRNVAVLNAVKESKLFGQSLQASPVKYLAGHDVGNGVSLRPAGTEIAANLYSNVIPQNDFDTKYYYYVFENEAVSAGEYPTIVTLIADFMTKTVYYPVHLASYEQWSAGSGSVTSIERGKSYDITITLSVDPTADEKGGGNEDGGDGGGTTDPTLPESDVKINVDVKLNDWDPVILNKEF